MACARGPGGMSDGSDSRNVLCAYLVVLLIVLYLLYILVFCPALHSCIYSMLNDRFLLFWVREERCRPCHVFASSCAFGVLGRDTSNLTVFKGAGCWRYRGIDQLSYNVLTTD